MCVPYFIRGLKQGSLRIGKSEGKLISEIKMLLHLRGFIFPGHSKSNQKAEKGKKKTSSRKIITKWRVKMHLSQEEDNGDGG